MWVRSPTPSAGCASAARGLGHGVGELVAADECEDRREGEQRDRAQHPERLLEAAGERRGYGVRRREAAPGCGSPATLEAIAIPIAPPSCWEVFSSPDASPAWCSATPASAAIEIGMNENAVPAPATTIGPARLATK